MDRRPDPKVKGTNKALVGLQLKWKGNSTSKNGQGGLPEQRGGPTYTEKVPSLVGSPLGLVHYAKEVEALKKKVLPPDCLEGRYWQVTQAAYWCFLEPGSSVLSGLCMGLHPWPHQGSAW